MIEDELIKEAVEEGIKAVKTHKETKVWESRLKDIYYRYNLEGLVYRPLSYSGYKTKVYRRYNKLYNNFNDPLNEGRCREYIDKTKERDWFNTYRRYLRDEARIESLKEEISNVANSLEAFPKVEYHPKEIINREGVLLLSDLHLGEDFINSQNSYNEQKAADRLSLLLSQTVAYCKLYNIDLLNVCNLGDMVDGIIQDTLRMEDQLDIVQQVTRAAELISEFMYNLRKELPNVRIVYRSVLDNHSRVTPNKKQSIEREQYGRFIDWWLEDRLADMNIDVRLWTDGAKNSEEKEKELTKNYRDYLDPGVARFWLQNGKMIICTHGHQDRKNDAFRGMVGLTKDWVDYICFGHYHNPEEKDFEGCKVFVNGCIVGVNEYAYANRWFAECSQTLLIFSTSNEDINHIEINLLTDEDKKRLKVLQELNERRGK